MTLPRTGQAGADDDDVADVAHAVARTCMTPRSASRFSTRQPRHHLNGGDRDPDIEELLFPHTLSTRRAQLS